MLPRLPRPEDIDAGGNGPDGDSTGAGAGAGAGAGRTAWTGFGDYVEAMGEPMSGAGNNADFEAMLEAALAKEAARKRKQAQA